MSNFVNLANLPGIIQYEDIFNTIAQARKIMMEPTGNNQADNLAAVRYVERSLSASGWNEASQGRKDEMILNLAQTTKRDLTNYLDEEDPSMTTENTIRNNLIPTIDNFLNNFINTDDIGAVEAAGGRRRKSRRYKKSRKSKRSKKTRKSRKSRKY
jgi:hypothetical protein